MDLKALKGEFDRNGYVMLSQFISEDRSRELQAKVEEFIRVSVPTMPPEHVFYENDQDNTSLKQLFHLSDYDPYFHQLIHGSIFEELAEVLLGEKMKKRFVEYFNKPARSGKPTPPHQDGYYFKLTPPQAITFWIPLEEVNQENGCLRYVKGSHLHGLRPHGRTATLGFSQGITDYGIPSDLTYEAPMPVDVGDVLVHHAMTIHRADQNKSLTRSRRVLALVYFGASAVEDIVSKADYQKELLAAKK
ncbi:phytanoyl-CoA hydroxylase [Dyadobacter jejuensis]|uniref:Phytanoyl-CoA hydroxylase n=1 Tax=Dyadobacter jejuensis TaxID=1082580 RepID=A0A316B6D6_9BACT|nr:phytanoyl-CoA dioxygenase family protein [Dyadobacter jejuensis]PWJ58157.1 phytanoyl-CoA hydroxylase [Dyadobacter jejuensis]